MARCASFCVIFVVIIAIVAYFAREYYQKTTHGIPAMFKAMPYERHECGIYRDATAEDILVAAKTSFKGKTAVVTGANTGLGKETARVMGKYGADVVMACRSMSRCDAAKADIEAEITSGGGSVITRSLDLNSLEAIDKFADDYAASGKPLHYLVNNAGIMALPSYETTVDGYEKQWGVNHLGHFRLTTKLLEILKASASKTKGGARIINLSSLAHILFPAVFPGLSPAFNNVSKLPLTEAEYVPELAYGSSKASNILFSLGLRKRLAGTGVLAVAGHPGIINTELGRNNWQAQMNYESVFPFLEKNFYGWPVLRDIPQGTMTTMCMAAHDLPDAYTTDKLYLSSCVEGIKGKNLYDDVVYDKDKAEQLWARSEELVTKALR
eukprot:gnl/MRDRNA2_/MRDRNA2_102828_c0_seq1.p1 gnl/MRDRNA2_/MRDRNA2_102828_c0~~gnl/MRDRNA2_/MRDRNA2_102828_c0_seq1.p1  ORF type:complete len:382 (+),score=53.10 gnl/MRDRNA2_/MRDRNA2_102828_c0_seq1:88-1233(+)